MFESLIYEKYQTQGAVEAALANTFMSNAKVPGAEYTYAWLFCWVGEKYNINPVALASRVRQEQGAGTSDLISENMLDMKDCTIILIYRQLVQVEIKSCRMD